MTSGIAERAAAWLVRAAAHGAALLISAGVTAAIYSEIPNGTGVIFPVALVVMLFMATVVGLPLYLLACWFNRDNWSTIGAAGFITGALLPALVFSLIGPADSNAVVTARWEMEIAVGGFGLLGALGGLVFRATLRLLLVPAGDGEGRVLRRGTGWILGIAGYLMLIICIILAVG